MSDKFPNLSDDLIQVIIKQAIQEFLKKQELVQIKNVGIDWEFKTVVSGVTMSTSKFTEGQAYLSPKLNQQVICNSEGNDTLKCETLEDNENRFIEVFKFTDNEPNCPMKFQVWQSKNLIL